MTHEKKKRTLIYKRTHEGDPDPKKGVFGNRDCLGRVRGWPFDATIGVGGKGREAKQNGIVRKLTWIGISSKRREKAGLRGPLVTFDHFRYYGKEGPLLETIAPALARHMYDGKVRVLRDSLSSAERLEVEKILNLARNAPPSERNPKG